MFYVILTKQNSTSDSPKGNEKVGLGKGAPSRTHTLPKTRTWVQAPRPHMQQVSFMNDKAELFLLGCWKRHNGFFCFSMKNCAITF